MKTLKKVLSVALVLAMALSLVTLAGAANVSKYQDFTDADAIVNKEAVDTLVGLGVINGMDDGSYAPNGHFTRAQASKIIAYLLLGENVAASLRASSAPFADVAATHWAAPYIQYCASRGILNGVGDNKFDPEGSVTAAQFAKMLLTAAGYGKKGEYVGADWAINAIVDAQNLKILDTGVDYMAPATRDEVARYAFNFYTNVVFVSYSKDKEDYEQKVVNSVAQTLAVQQNVKASETVVINGVASHKWLKNDLDLTGNYWPDSDIRVIYTYADGTALSNFITVGNPLFKAPAESITYYYNGYEVVEDATANTPALVDLKSDLGVTDLTGTRGWVVSLVDSDPDGLIDTVLVIKKSWTTLTSDPFVSAAGNVTIAGIVSNKPAKQVVGYQGLQKGDVVLYYTDAANVTYIEKARAVSGQLTQGSSSAITFAGSVYRPSGLASAVNFATLVSSAANFNKDAMIWLDDGNGVIKFELTTTPPALPVGVLVGYRYDSFTGTAVAKLVKEDGTLATYSVAPNIYGVAPDQRTVFKGLLTDAEREELELELDANEYGYLVNYSLDDQGRVTLSLTGLEDDVLGANYGAKNSYVVIDEERYYITNTTKVFYFNAAEPFDPVDNPVAVTTGYSATSAVTIPGDGSVDVTYKLVPGTSVLSAILFGAEGSVSATTDKFVFVTKFSEPTVTYDAFGNATHNYEVYAGGEKITLKSASANLFKASEDATTVTPGLYKIVVNEKGYVTSFTNSVEGRIEAINQETVLVTDGYVATNSAVVNINANTQFFVYDEYNAQAPVLPGSVEASTEYVHYTIKYVLKDQYGVAAQWVYYTYYVGL